MRFLCFCSLIACLHGRFYFIQFSDDLFQWDVIKCVTFQVESCALKVFQNKRNEVFTQYSLCAAVYFKPLGGLSDYQNGCLLRLAFWRYVYFIFIL